MPKKINAKSKEEFLEIFEKNHYSIRKSCREIKIGKSTFYRWLEDSEFKNKINKIKKKRKEHSAKIRKILADVRTIRRTTKFLHRYAQNRGY